MIRCPFLVRMVVCCYLVVEGASLYGSTPSGKAAPANTAPPNAQEIPRMIEHVENGDPSQRKQADRLLIQEGGAAMAALRAALAGPTTPGQRTRLRSVIAAVKGAAALQGPLISIRLSKVPLDIAFARICEKVGIHASPYAGYADRKPMLVTLQVNRRPFWDVMQRLALSSGYSPSYGTMTSPSGGSLLYARPGLLSKANLTSRYKGFMIAAQSIGRSSSEQLGGINAGTFFRGLDVGLAVLPPPYRSYKISFAQPQTTRATDSLHQSLLPDRRSVSSYFNDGSAGTLVYNLTTDLRYPPHLGSRIVLLRGYIPALLQSRAIKWTFTNLGKNRQSKVIDGFRVSIGRPKQSGVGWRTSI